MRIDVTDTPATLKELLDSAWYFFDSNVDGFKTVLLSNNYIGCGGAYVPNWPVMFEWGNARIKTGVDAYGNPVLAPAISLTDSMQLTEQNDIAIRTENLDEIQLVACPWNTVPLYVAIT